MTTSQLTAILVAWLSPAFRFAEQKEKSVKTRTRKLRLDQQARYEIQVQGCLDASWADWFDNVTITVKRGDDAPASTTLTGLLADQAARHSP